MSGQVSVQDLYHQLNLPSDKLIFWPASLSWQCMAIQHIVGNTRSLLVVLIQEGPNEVIETRLLALKTAIYPKLLSIVNGCIVHTSFTNLPDEFEDIVCHYIKGIKGLLCL